MIRRPPRSTQSRSSAASDVYKRQVQHSRAIKPVRVGGRIAFAEPRIRCQYMAGQPCRGLLVDRGCSLRQASNRPRELRGKTMWWHKFLQFANGLFSPSAHHEGALLAAPSLAAATPEGGGCIVGATVHRGTITPLVDHSDQPIFAVGPCRTGKSSGLTVPTLLQWQDSAVVFDIHGELHELTASWRLNSAGNQVIRFEPMNPSGSDRIDLLKEIRVGTTLSLIHI